MKVRKELLCFRAKREFLERAFSSDCFHENDEDLKVGVSSIYSLFSKIKIDDEGIEEESTLVRRRPDNSEGENLDEKIDKSMFREVKTLTCDMPTLLDYEDINYNNSSLMDCISLLHP